MNDTNFNKLIRQLDADCRAQTRGRRWGTMCNGCEFPESKVEQVWELGGFPYATVGGVEIKIDFYGGIMVKGLYGHRTAKYAWEIDHIRPVSLGGSDELWNLQPLQRKNNRTKSNSFDPTWAQVLASRLR